jgi:uncharacterized protein (UPF0212 family)
VSAQRRGTQARDHNGLAVAENRLFEVLTVKETRTLYVVSARSEEHAKRKAKRGHQKLLTRAVLKPYVADIKDITEQR